MHPLPPPPGKLARARDHRSEPLPPPAIPETSIADHNSQQDDPATAEGSKKKKRHRAGKKKRNRRQSFAAPSEDSALTELQTNRAAGDASDVQQQSMANKSMYRLGNAGANLSNTSLDSEALLDHRSELLVGKESCAYSLTVKSQGSADDAPSAGEQINP